MLSAAYWNNSVPVGWDTPVYIRLTKLTMQDGILGLVQETNYSHLYTIFSSFIASFGLIDPFALEILLPIVLSVIAVMLCGFAMWKWFRDKNLALFAAFFAIGWYTLFALTASLHRSLMAFDLLIVVLAYLPTYFEQKSLLLRALLCLIAVLMVLTHFETYIVSIGLLIAYALALKIVAKKTSTVSLLGGLLMYLVPLVVGVVVLFPFIPSFLAHYMVIMPTVSSSVPLLEFPLYLGGHLLPLVVLGLASIAKQLRNSTSMKSHLMLPLSWAFIVLSAALVVPLGIPLPQWRILVFFPVPFLSALGFDSSMKYLRKTKDRPNPSDHHKPIIAALALTVIIANSWVATLYASGWMHPYIDEETYQNLRWLDQNYSFKQKPIVLFYFKVGEYTGGTLALYRNWMNATIGEHYAYYGKLQYLLGGYAMPFQDPEYSFVSTRTWDELKPITPNIAGHDILLFEGDFYQSLSIYERSLLSEIVPHTFLLNSSFSTIPDLYKIRLTAYRDSYSSSNNWYSQNKWWAGGNPVAEHFENSTKTQFNMTFSLPIYKAGNYTINIRMFDYAGDLAPLKIEMDAISLCSVNFNGTWQPITTKLGPLFLQPKLHFLTLRIDDIEKAHRMSLDYVECLLEN